MHQPKTDAILQRTRAQSLLLLAGILAIAFNLRPTLAGVGPLTGLIIEGTGLSYSLIGLLNTLPLIAFGVVSALTPLATRRFGIAGTLAGALVLITLGAGLRYFNSIFSLFGGTILFGVGIAFGNVLLPSLVKRDFPVKSGMVTSLYSAALQIGAALGAGISLPLAVNADLGWRGSLGIWAFPAMVALFIWIPQLGYKESINNQRGFVKGLKSLLKSGRAWKIALFMGLQSFTYYVILAWLPEMLQAKGTDSITAGWLLSLTQAMGIFGSLLIPIWAGRRNNHKFIILALLSLELISLIALMMPSVGWSALWVSLLGFDNGGTFGLSLLFIVLRANDTETATKLSGMVQSIGYLVAATGPILLGSLFDLTGNWNHILLSLVFILFIKVYTGLGAAKPGKIAIAEG